MAIKNIGQQGIVFAVFTALFAIFALALPGFLTASNMLTLLQNVAVHRAHPACRVREARVA